MATRTPPTRTKRPPRRALSTYAPPPSSDEEWEFADAERAPRWPAVAGLVVSLAGLAVATYLTVQHFDTGLQLSCPTHGIINCEKVTQSSYSKIMGIPVAVLGLVFFVVMAVFQLPVMWRSHRREIRAARLGWSVVGVGTALWLVYAELFRIDNICLWCSSVHLLSLILFGITVFGTVATATPPEFSDD
jgi:uncharacterized membrane protein